VLFETLEMLARIELAPPILTRAGQLALVLSAPSTLCSWQRR
jgi:hypothetical protein